VVVNLGTIDPRLGTEVTWLGTIDPKRRTEVTSVGSYLPVHGSS
jgi:hypothetical protein